MLIISILFIISIFSLYNICKIRKLYLSLQPQTRNNGAIAQLVEQRTENPCVPGSIPGGTTFTKRKIMKTAEIQLFQRFFLYILSAKYAIWCNKKLLIRWLFLSPMKKPPICTILHLFSTICVNHFQG